MKVDWQRRKIYTLFFAALMIQNLAACNNSEIALTSTSYPEQMTEMEMVAMISLKTREDVYRRRELLLEFLFGESSLPTGEVELNTYIPSEEAISFLDAFELASPEIITVRMEYRMVSNMILLHAVPQSNTLVLYHSGHPGFVENDRQNLLKLVNAGFDVLYISMPLAGINRSGEGSNPNIKVETLCCGKPYLKETTARHNQLGLIPDSLRFFVKPIAIVLDYAEELGYERFVLIGISGGGWTAVLYSAIDDRISMSIPVAGSTPLWLRDRNKERGDFEQLDPELYAVANYLELYIMGAFGEGRLQYQIFNFYDPCCFGKGRSAVYLDVVQANLERLGAGQFELYVDYSEREHMISPAAMNIILELLSEG